VSGAVAEYRRLAGRSSPNTGERPLVALILIGPQPQDIVTLADQLTKVKALAEHRSDEDVERLHRDFLRRWPQLPKEAVTGFAILVGFPPLFSEEYDAVAARLLRKVAPFTDYTDRRVRILVTELTGRFARARHSRGSTTLAELQSTALAAALPLEMVMFGHAYVKTTYGYVPHPRIAHHLAEELRDVQSAARIAMRRYRRATRAFRLAAMLKGPIRCIACNGPLMANLYGYSRRGIACSHCGFSPFVTLLYACSCGRPVALCTQPPLDPVDMALALRDGLQARCEHCGQEPRPERLQSRTFQLNIPWPPESFTDGDLVAAREDHGWRANRGFRDGKADPMDALLAEQLVDPVAGRFPNDDGADEVR
jgi:hypothetical protein